MGEALPQSEPTIAAALRWLSVEFGSLADLAERCEGRLSALRRERLFNTVDESRIVLASHRQALVSACDNTRTPTATVPGKVDVGRASAAGVDLDRLSALHADGLTDPQIATAMGCKTNLIFFWRRQLGLPSNYGTAQRSAARGGDVITADAGGETDG